MFSVDLINGKIVGESPTKYVVLRRPSTVVFSEEGFLAYCPAELDSAIGHHFVSRNNGEVEVTTGLAEVLFDLAISKMGA